MGKESGSLLPQIGKRDVFHQHLPIGEELVNS
jgi:hypothetical protein